MSVNNLDPRRRTCAVHPKEDCSKASHAGKIEALTNLAQVREKGKSREGKTLRSGGSEGPRKPDGSTPVSLKLLPLAMHRPEKQ